MAVLVLVDVDGTLIRMTSSERAFFPALVQAGLFGPRQAWGYARFLVRYGPRLGGAVWKKNKGYLSGTPVEQVRAVAREFVDREVVPSIRPSMRERITRHLKNGDRVCLLTGTPDFIAAPLGEAIGVSDIIATICATDGGRFIAAPPVQHPYAEDKRRLAEAWAERRSMSLAEAVAYGNSFSDRHLLESVGTPVAVAPDRRLREMARNAGWEILEV